MNLMAIIPICSSMDKWVYYWFSSIDLRKIANGSNVPQINNKDVAPLIIPVPPVEEQKKIINKLLAIDIFD